MFGYQIPKHRHLSSKIGEMSEIHIESVDEWRFKQFWMDPSSQTSDIRSFGHLSISYYVHEMKVLEKWGRIANADDCEWFTKSSKEYFYTKRYFWNTSKKWVKLIVYIKYDRVDEYINDDGFMYIVTYGRMFWNEIKRENLLPHVVVTRIFSVQRSSFNV